MKVDYIQETFQYEKQNIKPLVSSDSKAVF